MADQLSSDLFQFLNQRENFTTNNLADTTAALEAFKLPAPKEDEWFDGPVGATFNFLGDTLWSAFDTAAFGLPSLIGEKTDLYDIPEIESEWARGIGGLAGFIYGGPMYVGAKLARVAAKPFIHKLGRHTVGSAGRAFSKKIGEKSLGLSKDAVKYARGDIRANIGKLSEFAKWNSKRGKNWGKFAKANIDDAIKEGRKLGLIKTQKEANIISQTFKREVVDKGRPMKDFIDIALSRGWSKDPHKAIALGSMLHEAMMFGAIDAVRDAVDMHTQDRKYDVTAPIWGLATGTGFGALKFMKPAGRASSSAGDWKQGISAIFGFNKSKGYSAYKNMTDTQLIGVTEVLGTEIERSGLKGVDHVIRSGSGALSRYGKKLEKGININLKDPTLDLLTHGKTGREFLEAELRVIRGKYGKELIKESTKAEFRQMWENKGKMFIGGAIMNAHTLFGLAQGHDMDMDEVLPHLLIGAFINRKGTPKTQDFNVRQMGRLRRQLKTLGYQPHNYIDYTLFPADLASGRWESINPLKDPVFKELREITENKGLVSDDYNTTDIVTNDGSMSVELAQKMGRGDYAIFQEYYNWLAGASGHKYIKPFSMITSKEAMSIVEKIKTIEYVKPGQGEIETIKLNKPENFREALIDITESNTDVLKTKVLSTLHRIASRTFGADYRINALNDQTIGVLPEYIRIKKGDGSIGERVFKNGDGKTDIEWIRDPKSNKLLTGKDAERFVDETIEKVNNLLKFGRDIGKSETVTGNKKVLEIRSLEQLFNMHAIVTKSEGLIDKGLQNFMEGTKFSYLDKLESMANDMIQVDFKRKIDYISQTFDQRSSSWNGIETKLSDLGLAVSPKPGKLDLLANVHDQVEIITKPGQEHLANSYKSFLGNLVSVLGAKGRDATGLGSDRTTGIQKKVQISIDQIDTFRKHLNDIGIPNRISLFNDFASQISNRIYTERVSGTNLGSGDVNFVMRMMSDFEIPLVTYSKRGFEVTLLADFGGKDTESQGIIEKYNATALALHEAGKKEGKGSFIEIAGGEKNPDKLAIFNKNDLFALHIAMMTHKGEAGKATGELLIDFINVLDGLPVTRNQNGTTNDWNSRLSVNLTTFLNKHGGNNRTVQNRLLNWLMGNGVIKPKPGKKAKGIIEYEFFPDKLAEGSQNYRKLNRKLQVEFNTSMKEIDTLVKQAHKDFEDDSKINQHSANTEGNMTQQEFFTRYFPNIGEKGDALGSVHSVDSQSEMLKKAIYGPSVDPDHRMKDPYLNLLKQADMKIKVKGEYISALEVWTKPGEYQKEIVQLRADMTKIFKSYQQGKARILVQVSNAGVEIGRKEHYFGTKFDKVFDDMNLDFHLIDGKVEFYDNRGGDISKRAVNVFHLDSDYIGDGPTFSKREHLEKVRDEIFVPLLEAHYQKSESGFIGDGFHVVTFGNGKNRIVVDKGEYKKVADSWLEKVYNKYINSPDISGSGKKQLEKLKNRLFDVDKTTKKLTATEMWDNTAHDLAIRNIIAESMLTGKNKSLFAKSLDWSGAELTDYFTSRLSLFHTPKFSRLNISDVSKIPLFNEKEVAVVDSYAKGARKGKIGVAVWNDKTHADIKNRIETELNLNWREIMGERKSNSGYDSISFISKRFMDLLNITEGGGATTRTTFKPIITSTGESMLMLGKTVFVYSPEMQKRVFAKSNNLDILMTKTADKLESAPSYLEMSMNGLLNIGAKRLNENIFDIDMESIGIRGYEKDSFASESYSKFNFMTSNEVDGLVQDMYLGKLRNASDFLHKIKENPFYANAAVRQLKRLGHDTTMEDLAGSDAGRNLGSLIQWVAVDPQARPEVFGPNMLYNMLKTKFIDPIISPESITPDGRVYGMKSVLSKDPSYDNLGVTTLHVDGKGRGEMVAPHRAREGSINFKEEGMETLLVNRETGKIVKAKDKYVETLMELNPKMTEEQAKTAYEALENLGNLHDAVRGTELLADFDVGMIATRYPRNRPNDLAILRLRDFLTKEHGNQVIVNDLDVYSIFEGDYDVDKLDFFWGQHRNTHKHILRQKERWVNNVDPKGLEPASPNLKMIGDSFTETKKGWETHDANQRVLEGAIGQVQKTLRLVEHVSQLGHKITEEGNLKDKRLLINIKDEERIVMDMSPGNAKLWFARYALESQMIIDHKKGVHSDLLKNLADWRNEFLFPEFNKSITFDQLTKDDARTPNTNRIRLFRKYTMVNGNWKESEDNLNPMEKDHIRAILENHSKFTSLNSKVYTSGLEGKTPTYKDMIDISKDYFNFLYVDDGRGGTRSDIGNSTFKKLVGRYGYKSNPHYDQFRRWYGGKNRDFKIGIYKSKVKKIGKEKWHEVTEEQAKDPSNEGKWHYILPTSSPWAQGLTDNAKKVQQGEYGSVTERIFNHMWRTDPLKDRYSSEFVLTGDLLTAYEQAESMILGSEKFEKWDMEQAMPAIIKDVSTAAKIIKNQKRTIVKLNENRYLSETAKAKRITALNEIIKSNEAKIEELFSEEYKKNHKGKDLPKINLVDIQSNEEVREGTVRLWTLEQFHQSDSFRSKSKGYTKRLLDLKSFVGKDYSETNTLGQSTQYGGRSLHDSGKREQLKSPAQMRDIEKFIQDELHRGFEDFGLKFLIDFARPKTGELSLGVYNGRVMPIAVKPTTNYKRVIQYMLDIDMRAPGMFTSTLKAFAKRDAAYSNFFSGKYRYIPTNDVELSQHLQNIPNIPKMIKGFAANYTDLSFKKDIINRHVFGMGPEYDNTVSFYRQLLETYYGEHPDKAAAIASVEKFTKGISYMSQLSIENGYANPISKMVLLDKMKQEIADRGIIDAISHGVNIEGKPVDVSLSLRSHPLFGMIMGGKAGISLEPMKMLNSYKLDQIKLFNNQSKEVLLTPEAEGKSWKEAKEESEAKYCRGKL